MFYQLKDIGWILATILIQKSKVNFDFFMTNKKYRCEKCKGKNPNHDVTDKKKLLFLLLNPKEKGGFKH